jgi:hypothetical protein
MIELPPFDWQLVGSVVGGAVLIAALLWFWRWYRHRRARLALLAAVTGGAFEHLRDVLLPDGQGALLHVDFLLLTARGAVVIDLRDIVGNIFGGDQMDEWTVIQRSARQTFANPQAALYDRIAAVRALAPELPVEGRVVFSHRGCFPKGLPSYTLMLESLGTEFPTADRSTMEALLARWLPEWQRITSATMPSSLVEPKAAI